MKKIPWVTAFLAASSCGSPLLGAAFSPSTIFALQQKKSCEIRSSTWSLSQRDYSSIGSSLPLLNGKGPDYGVTVLQASLSIPAIAKPMFPPTVRNAMMVTFALLLVLQRRRIFYPGSAPDSSHAEPLPPGTIGGCPWVGNLQVMSGFNKFLYDMAEKLGSPKVWKMYTFANPVAVVSGSTNIRSVLGKEFRKDGGVSQVTTIGNLAELFGKTSLSFETEDKGRYNFLRRLVGQSMTAEAVGKSIPALQEASESAVERVLSSKEVVMQDVCKYLTLDVSWRQILGFDLKSDEEIRIFHEQVDTWLKGLIANQLLFAFIPLWILRRTKTYKAKVYLTRMIEEKIDELERNGPDGSTLSEMVFATDEDDASKKLTRQQVIDNSLLLIIAGSETSAATLTDAMLLLGIHPDKWEAVVAEQERLVEKYGNALDQRQLDKECPYLDAVVKETMRMMPVSGGGVRTCDETLVIEGVQIPKKWWAMYSISLTHQQDPITKKDDGSHMDMKKGFEPERWLDESTRPTTEFMPWGAGARFCLGHTLATAEMKTFLATMARRVKRFDLVTDVDKVRWVEGVIATPKDGVVIAAH